MKIKAAILAIAVITASILVPVYYDNTNGSQSLPTSPVYGLELIGENIKCSLTLDRKACLLQLSDERTQEAKALRSSLTTIFDDDERIKYNLLIVQTENTANRLRLEAERN